MPHFDITARHGRGLLRGTRGGRPRHSKGRRPGGFGQASIFDGHSLRFVTQAFRNGDAQAIMRQTHRTYPATLEVYLARENVQLLANAVTEVAL